MKLLVISKSPFRTNGISSVLRNLYLNPIFKGWDITFCFPEKSGEDSLQELKNHGFQVCVCPKNNYLTRYLWLKRFFKKCHFDASHINCSSATAYLEVHAAYRSGCKKIIVHSHSSNCKHKFIHKIFKRALNREMTNAIACSELAGEWLFSKPYEIISNGIVVSDFIYNKDVRAKYRDMLGLENSFVIGNVANLNPEKNQMYLLEVFALILPSVPSAKLMIVGTGCMAEQIRTKAKELGVFDKVLFLGTRTDAAQLYQAMDVFVLPSLFEGLPVVLIEAQAAGLRCLVSNNVDRSANITGNMAFIPIGAADKEAWAKAITGSEGSRERAGFGTIVSNSSFNVERSVQKFYSILATDEAGGRNS